MLKKVISEKLNDQINREAFSAYLYYSMSAYFESINLKGFANWMTMQAQEEIAHTHRLFTYINDKGDRVLLSALDEPQHDWDSPLACIEDAYNHECLISECINECVTLALKENDHATNAMLQWFVSEQVEEEANADDLVQKLKLIGDNSSGLYMLDAELGKRTFDPAAEAGQ